MITQIAYKHSKITPPARQQAVLETLHWLSANFPQLFEQSSAPKQLKVGILEDIELSP